MSRLINTWSVFPLLLVGMTLMATSPRSEAQLFKGAAQRRAARQGGSSNSGTPSQRSGLFGGREKRQSSQQSGSQYQQPKTGLLGRPKEPKEKTGLFGRPKEDKPGLFARARERREQEASARQRTTNQYTPKNYTQQQLNQYASSNSVHRSQSVTSSQTLFGRQPETPAETAASIRKDPNRPTPTAATLASGGDVSGGGASSALRAELAEVRSKLPDLSRPGERPTRPENAKRQAAIIRSRPKLPRRTAEAPELTPAHPALRNTSEGLPTAEPTGSLPKPYAESQSHDATLA